MRRGDLERLRSHTQTLPVAVYDGLVPVTFPLPVLLSSTLSIINLDSSPLFPLSTLLISFPSLLSSHLLVPFSPLTSFSPASSPSLLLSLLVSFHLDFLLLLSLRVPLPLSSFICARSDSSLAWCRLCSSNASFCFRGITQVLYLITSSAFSACADSHKWLDS